MVAAIRITIILPDHFAGSKIFILEMDPGLIYYYGIFGARPRFTRYLHLQLQGTVTPRGTATSTRYSYTYEVQIHIQDTAKSTRYG
jgi:hypothetical protein